MSSAASLSKREDRQFILECTEVYKTFPALWDIQCKDYSNRQKKNDAYDILVEKYRERNPEAGREEYEISLIHFVPTSGKR
jgi:hypothetical protein